MASNLSGSSHKNDSPHHALNPKPNPNQLGVMHTFLGPPLADMLRADVKPALMTTIEEKFKDCPQSTPGSFAAARTSRVAAASGGGRGGGGGGGKAARGDGSRGGGGGARGLFGRGCWEGVG